MHLSFIEADGREFTVEAEAGESVMSAAVRNSVEGIVGECGGSLSCATCHVYVHIPDGAELPELDDMEDAMLDGAACDRKQNSRLCCQIKVDDVTAEWTYELPESQY